MASPRIRKNQYPVFLIEDHHEAHSIWKKYGLRKMALVHLDAHIDFGFHEIKDIATIAKEARTLKELTVQLEKAVLFHKKGFDREKLTHIGNYIYPAMRDAIVDIFYWVIPGGTVEFRKSLGPIRRALRDLHRQDPCPYETPRLAGPGLIITKLYGRPMYVCVLDSLPVIDTPALLDIDTDFLVIPSVREADPFVRIGNRKPWIDTDELIRKVQLKVNHPRLTTIAYSVNGGFTPMVYKTLGDSLFQGLGSPDQGLADRLRAGEYFVQFRAAFDRKEFHSAGSFYSEAVKLNPAYRVSDNSYGPLYFQVGDYRLAEKEWQGILKIDPDDADTLSGLGKIRLARRNYKAAAKYFARALRLKTDHRESLAGFAETQYHLGNFKEAETLIHAFEQLDPMQDFSRFLSGKIYEKTGKPMEAMAKYKEALQLGMTHIDVLTRLYRLSQRFDRENLDFLRARCLASYKSFLRFGKKALLKNGKRAEAKRTETRYQTLLASFSLEPYRKPRRGSGSPGKFNHFIKNFHEAL